jgi:phage replication O-like protein O
MGGSKKGFMRVPNDIAEAIISAPLTANELKVLFVIMRQTYGFNRTEKDISISQIQKITGLAKGGISAALTKLKSKNIIKTEKQAKNKPQIVSINTNVIEWLGVHEHEHQVFTGVNTSVHEHEPILLKDNIKDISLKTTLKTAEEAAAAEVATQIKNLFNNICHSYPQVIVLTEADTAAISITLGRYDIEQFKVVFEKAEASSYLKGDNQRKWRASFDWLIKIANFEKTLNGKYDNSPETSAQNITPSPMPSEPESSFSAEEWYRQALAYDPEQMFKGG